jgi:formylglycine-generating enzyme required for sulfatase activity
MKSLYFLFVVIVFISCSKDKETSTLESITIPSVSTPNDKSFGVETPMVYVNGGKYIPLYGGKNNEVEVNNLLIDVYPVSSENFLAFVKQNKRWRKSQIKNFLQMVII